MNRLYVSRDPDIEGWLEVGGKVQDWERVTIDWVRVTGAERIRYELLKPRVSLASAILILGVVYALKFITEVLA